VESMPANLPPECKTLEQKYFEAKTLPEKIKALEEYHSAIPKHKGTERLRARLKTSLSKLKLELEYRQKKISTSSASSRYSVKKEGAAQVVLLGCTGSGKSSLLKSLTNAKPEVGTYPFTTIEPVPGMMIFEDLQIQLVEAPALFVNASEGKGWGSRTLSLARNTDGLILIVDLASQQPEAQLKMMLKELKGARIRVEDVGSKVEIERKEGGGIQIINVGNFKGSIDEIQRFLVRNKVPNAVVRLWGEVDLEEVARSLVFETIYKPTLVVANKIDCEDSTKKIEKMRRFYDKINIIGVSTRTGFGLELLPRMIFKSLNLVRIYTKKPRQKPAEKPMIMKRATTVENVAKEIHSEYLTNFKYAKIWGSTDYPGARVGLKYILRDGDVIEIHIG